MSAEPRITMIDVREAKLCARGAREVAARLGIDWGKFLQEGLSVEDAEATGNAVLIDLASRARARAEKE